MASGDNKFYQLNAANISQQIANFSSITGMYYSPALSNNYFYLPVDNVLFQLNASNITQIISNLTVVDMTYGDMFSCPAAANGYVYVGNWDHKIYQLNATNISHVIKTYITGDRIYSCPAIANGYLYIGSYDTKIYQLNATDISKDNVPPPAPALPEPLSCGITFSDTEAPVIQVVTSASYCNPCVTTPFHGVYLKVNVTDNSPLKSVILEQLIPLTSSYENVSLPRLGNSINYEFIGEPRSNGYGFHAVYAIDWNNNIHVIYPSTPSTSGGCSSGGCASASPALTDYSFTPSIMCLGEEIMVNATASFYPNIRNLLLMLENPDSDFPYVSESIYLENLEDDSFGVIYHPAYRGVYNLTLKSTSTNYAVAYYPLGNVSLYE